MSDFTRAEVCAVAVAEVFRGNGEILASSFGTVPAVGARLARLTFSPDLLMTDGIATLVASTRPLRSRMRPRLACSGSLCTKRFSPCAR